MIKDNFYLSKKSKFFSFTSKAERNLHKKMRFNNYLEHFSFKKVLATFGGDFYKAKKSNEKSIGY